LCYIFYYSPPPPTLHSFPTRRSSDLGNDAPIFAELHVAPRFRATVVTGRAVRIEADQSRQSPFAAIHFPNDFLVVDALEELAREDRKSTRLNSSHQIISYAVFCLKKK